MLRRLAVSSLAAGALLAAVPAVAQTGDFEERLQSLVDEIRSLADEAERTRAADTEFIRDLRGLARRYDWPWRTEILGENFRRGTLPGSWVIDSGRFRVDPGNGLRTTAAAEAPAAAAEEAPERRDGGDADAALAILDSVLGRLTEGGGRETREEAAPAPAETTLSALHVPSPVTNAFALEMVIAAEPPEGTMEFGPYQGTDRDLGYVLAYAPGTDRPIELLRVSGRGSAIIDSYRQPLEAADGREHRILWTRDQQGQMTVSFDGEELIRVIDRGFADPFDGLVIVNRGGTFIIAEVGLHGTS